jgi:hypothetical protein
MPLGSQWPPAFGRHPPPTVLAVCVLLAGTPVTGPLVESQRIGKHASGVSCKCADHHGSATCPVNTSSDSCFHPVRLPSHSATRQDAYSAGPVSHMKSDERIGARSSHIEFLSRCSRNAKPPSACSPLPKTWRVRDKSRRIMCLRQLPTGFGTVSPPGPQQGADTRSGQHLTSMSGKRSKLVSRHDPWIGWAMPHQ